MTSKATSLLYTPARVNEAFSAFRRAYPAFDSTSRLDELRASDYKRLDEQGQIYLDYTGGGLYAESQLRAHLEMLSRKVFGNPHSDNPTSRAATELDERARAFVLEYFNASPEEYVAIFTPNASGALKLVGESYPFTADSQYLLTYDNHNSVNGIREFARARGASVSYVSVTPPDLRVDEVALLAALDQPKGAGPRLFSYPAQSNFSGVQHPLEWIEVARAKGWDVLVDAAAFVPTNRLDLSQWKPDFIPLSFYKLFGYPTGIGCLLARRAVLRTLQRPWFAGGSIWAVSVESERIFMADDEAAFEDGTINYLMLPAIEIGLRHLQSVGVETIHTRVACLTGWLLESLLALRHSNGQPIVQVYGPRDTHLRGGTIAMNFFTPAGKVVDERLVDMRASAGQISLRTGCFCNPGAGEIAMSISKEAIVRSFQREERPPFDEFLEAMGLETGGAVRVSLGLATTFADVYRFMQFAETFRDATPDESGLPSRRHC
ncbi:MAG TPA: aminotransferase class V-fold PLP-dependent enzyme [Ktedonobacterales bacterium]